MNQPKDTFDFDLLILKVKENPALYDLSDINNNNRNHTAYVWEKISVDLKVSVKELKKRWHQLRTNYMRIKRLEKQTGLNSSQITKWPFYKPLSFLEPYCQFRFFTRKKPKDSPPSSPSSPYDPQFQTEFGENAPDGPSFKILKKVILRKEPQNKIPKYKITLLKPKMEPQLKTTPIATFKTEIVDPSSDASQSEMPSADCTNIFTDKKRESISDDDEDLPVLRNTNTSRPQLNISATSNSFFTPRNFNKRKRESISDGEGTDVPATMNKPSPRSYKNIPGITNSVSGNAKNFNKTIKETLAHEKNIGLPSMTNKNSSRPDKNDPDRLFLLSLLPSLKKLYPEDNIDFKLVALEFFKSRLNPTSSGRGRLLSIPLGREDSESSLTSPGSSEECDDSLTFSREPSSPQRRTKKHL